MNEPYTDKELRRIQREDHRSPTTLRFLATVARLQERVEGLDTDLTEMTETMREHFDSGDLNDLPVSLTKGIEALEALAERRKKVLKKAIAWREEKRTYTLHASWFAGARAAIEERT